jgi:hypothetical protein
MWTPSRGSNARRSGHRRIADYLADDQTTTTATDASDNESYTTAYGEEFFAAAAAGSGGAGGMLPAFLADQGDLVEVMLELDEESMVVRSVTPTSAALYGAASLPAPPSAGVLGVSPSPRRAPSEGGGRLSRCSSTSSRIRKKFAWLRSPSPSPSPYRPTPAELQREAAMAARERRREQAQLNRSRAGARRALKGLRFISRTTGSVEAAELWRRVEERFNDLAREGLLSRDDFGECIGTATLDAAAASCLQFTLLSSAHARKQLDPTVIATSLSAILWRSTPKLQEWWTPRSSRWASSTRWRGGGGRTWSGSPRRSSTTSGSRSPIRASTRGSRSSSTCTELNFTRPHFSSFPRVPSKVTSQIDPSQFPVRAHLHYALRPRRFLTVSFLLLLVPFSVPNSGWTPTWTGG